MQPNAMGPTSIALIVDSAPPSALAAVRYVHALPSSAVVHVLVEDSDVRHSLRCEARARDVVLSRAHNLREAVLYAELIVVIGRNPFTRSQVDILAASGVPVECRDLNCGKKRRRGRWPKRAKS